jgi:hypothetical protein
LRIPDVVGLGSGRPLANLPASARIRCFEQLAHKADDGGVVAVDRAVPRRCRMAPAAGGRDGLIARFVDVVDERQGSPRFARALPQRADLAALLAAYARAVGDGSRSKRRGGDPGPRKSLAA